MKPSLNNYQPDAVVIHIGSNDVSFGNLRSETAVKNVAENIIKIALLCKEYGVSEVVVSSILPKRNIKLSNLIRKVNDILYYLCKINNVYFLSNGNICRNFICDDGAHLNQKGTHILASNLITFINSIFNFNWLYSEFCLTENCNSRCLSGNNINESTKLSNNSYSVLSPWTNINEEVNEETLSILNKRRKDSFDRLIFGNLNINSISSKFDQMKFLLQGKVDIFVSTETKLDNSFPTNQFLIEELNLITLFQQISSWLKVIGNHLS